MLTKTQEDTCTYGGLFGVLLGATCLIQLLTITSQHWLATVLILATTVSIVPFILLCVKKFFAPACLVVSLLLILGTNFIVFTTGVFSLVAFLYLGYLAAMITILFMGQYPAKLKAIADAKRQEELEWANKI